MNKRKAIIVDIDGTLANDLWRSKVYKHPKKDYGDMNIMSKYDGTNFWCQEIVQKFHKDGYEIVFLTARGVEGKQVTQAWLNDHAGVENYHLIMRNLDDRREDWIIKKEKYHEEIEPSFDVLFALDDKQSVTNMFRELGITVLHCGEKY